MAVTVAQFRADVPALADPGAYPDSTVAFWLAVAAKLLRPDVYGSVLDLATEMFVAHNVVLEAQLAAQSGAGAPPTGPSGPVSSEGVGPLSTSYDTSAAIDPGAGHWNLTVYGTRFLTLAKTRTAGLSLGVGPRGILGPGSAWAGPPSGYAPGY